MHIYEVRPRKDKQGVDLISNALPFGRLWYGEPNAVANAIGYAQHYSRSQNAVIRVYDAGRQRDPDARACWRFQRVVMPCVRRAWRSSRAGVIQPLSGPDGSLGAV
jgi:hypothetical protein